jgi:hypothetical protein
MAPLRALRVGVHPAQPTVAIPMIAIMRRDLRDIAPDRAHVPD